MGLGAARDVTFAQARKRLDEIRVNFAPDLPGSLEPFVVEPEEAMRLLDCSSSYPYGVLIPQGLLETYKEGRARKITLTSIKVLIQRRLEAAKQDAA